VTLLKRDSQPDRLSESAEELLATLSARMTKATLVKAGLVAGSLAALTAASAGISSLRRRLGEVDDSA
jgi:hypothetical protein